MACCKCCCGNAICEEGDEGKCCCGGEGPNGDCCEEGEYCCDGVCQEGPCPQCVPCPECAINAALFSDLSPPNYYSRTFILQQNDFSPSCFPFGGINCNSTASQQLWKCCPLTPGSFFVPAPNVPEFTWNAGYPDQLEGCTLYFVLDAVTTTLLGTNCCTIDFDANANPFLRCSNRTDRFAHAGNFRWRLMKIDCNGESLVDITGEALTPVGVFEGEFNQLDYIFQGVQCCGCDSIARAVDADYFDDPTVVCE